MLIIPPKQQPKQQPKQGPLPLLNREQLINGLRIHCFRKYKLINKELNKGGTELYSFFAKIWDLHPIHNWDENKIRFQMEKENLTEKYLYNLTQEWYKSQQRYLDRIKINTDQIDEQDIRTFDDY